MREDFKKESKERTRSLPSGAEEMLSHQSQLLAEGKVVHRHTTHRDVSTKDLCDCFSFIMVES